MQIELPDGLELQSRAAAAGFASISDYLMMLVERDAQRATERAAIQEGLDAVRRGEVQPFEDFDREFRARHNIALQE